MRALATICICLLLVTPPWGRADAIDDCGERETDHERRTCYSQAHKQADRRLSDAYRKLMNELKDDYERLLFRHAQIAWKRFSDAQCDLETFAYRGDPASASMRDRCMAEHMEVRRRQIEAYSPKP